MIRLYLVANSEPLDHAPAAFTVRRGPEGRRDRLAPRLRLVSDTGRQFRGRPRQSEVRRHNWLTLSVAAAAIAAAGLVSTLSFGPATLGGISTAQMEDHRNSSFPGFGAGDAVALNR